MSTSSSASVGIDLPAVHVGISSSVGTGSSSSAPSSSAPPAYTPSETTPATSTTPTPTVHSDPSTSSSSSSSSGTGHHSPHTSISANSSSSSSSSSGPPQSSPLLPPPGGITSGENVPRRTSTGTGQPERRRSVLAAKGVESAHSGIQLQAVPRTRTRSIVNLGAAITTALGGEPRKPRTAEDVIAEAKISGSRRNDYFVCRSAHDAIWDLGSDPEKGLSAAEAKQRLEDVGSNELQKEPPVPFWRLLLSQFEDILVIMLIIASIASLVLGEYFAAAVIILIVIANAALGVVQETRAEAALDALKSVSAEKAFVIREGKREEVDSKNLVPGDIIVLELGAQIPADIRLVTSNGLVALEAALTGESEGVKKDAAFIGTHREITKEQEEAEKAAALKRLEEANKAKEAYENKVAELKKTMSGDDLDDALAVAAREYKTAQGGGEKKEEKHLDEEKNMVFMGCQVMDGSGIGIVVKTGMATKMGSIQQALNSADKKASPLEQKLETLGNQLGIASITISVVVLIIGITTGRGVDEHGDQPAWLQMILIAVSLTVAAVPEGLPACVTVTLAIGMAEMAKRNAIIRELHSVETLGSASVICSDKTGTLTAGKMTAVRLWYAGQQFAITGVGYDPNGYVVPVDTKLDDEKSVLAGAEAVKARPNCTLSLMMGFLCSDAELQYVDREISDKEKTELARQMEENKKAGKPVVDLGKEWKCVGNATDRPIVVGAYKAGFSKQTVEKHFNRMKAFPFNSARKMMSVLIQRRGLTDEKTPEKPSEAKTEIKAEAKLLPDINIERMFPEIARIPYFAIAKGAPNIILEHCVSVMEPSPTEGAVPRTLTPADREYILKTIDELSSQAFRVLAIAFRPFTEAPPITLPQTACEENLILTGLVASIDPERPGVKASIEKAHHAGIRVVMITGDYLLTARAIAENIDIIPKTPLGKTPPNNAVDCAVVREIGDEIDRITKELGADPPPESKRRKELRSQLENANKRVDAVTASADVYARAKPLDKITIVRSLQRQGNVCSMTGDGVNDAPALKQADIGVAMGITGTAVAKSAAKIVLTDDNFVSIVEAIEQGRTIYNNITKFVYYLLTTNVSEVFFILIAVCLGLPSPLHPIQILWLNLTTDGAPAIALAVEPCEKGVMDQGPRLMTEPLIEKVMVTGIIVHTIVLTGCLLGTYFMGLHWYVPSFSGGYKTISTVNGTTTQYIAPWSGENLSIKDDCDTGCDYWQTEDSEGLKKARTMSILYIVFAELLRAYTSRSLRVSLFTQGVFSNKWMQPGTLVAAVATAAMVNIPGLQDVVFKTTYVDGKAWGWVIGLCFIPAFMDEFVKLVYRTTGFGERPKARRVRGGAPPAEVAVTISSGDKKESAGVEMQPLKTV